MKKTILLLAVLMLTIAAEAQYLNITTGSGTKTYSAADLTSSSPVTFANGTTMTALTGMTTMSRNFQPLMGTFFGVAFRKYGIPISAIVIGEFIISIIFNGFVALGAPTTKKAYRSRRKTCRS